MELCDWKMTFSGKISPETTMRLRLRLRIWDAWISRSWKTPLESHASYMRLRPETHGKTHQLPETVFLGFQPVIQLQNSAKTTQNTSNLYPWTQTCQIHFNTSHYHHFSSNFSSKQLKHNLKPNLKLNTITHLSKLAQTIHSSNNHFGGVLLPPTAVPKHINTYKIFL